ncbi:GNAT family N-acetyltransferase [Bradyrhizobium sp. AZCC 2289]|uniref:GNAT family N-acetyltransferase n=1 Tax=Bradyrhizobium sp. AZCC 2289 TaxID=3117026 RepID=UPI002FF07D3D
MCVADHKNDPAILGRWLSNKTPETFRSWIRPKNSLLVAIENNDILVVGCVTDGGEITLNYVSPDARFCGVSTTLLASLEKRAIERGNEVCKLESAETARRFYLAQGYSEEGPPGAGSAALPATRCPSGSSPLPEAPPRFLDFLVRNTLSRAHASTAASPYCATAPQTAEQGMAWAGHEANSVTSIICREPP